MRTLGLGHLLLGSVGSVQCRRSMPLPLLAWVCCVALLLDLRSAAFRFARWPGFGGGCSIFDVQPGVPRWLTGPAHRRTRTYLGTRHHPAAAYEHPTSLDDALGSHHKHPDVRALSPCADGPCELHAHAALTATRSPDGTTPRSRTTPGAAGMQRCLLTVPSCELAQRHHAHSSADASEYSPPSHMPLACYAMLFSSPHAAMTTITAQALTAEYLFQKAPRHTSPAQQSTPRRFKT
jgi:hypothetical protein